MRIVFMGTPEFAIPSLRILLEHDYPIVGVVTVPDKPAGRGQRVVASAVKQFAVDQSIPVLQPERLKDQQFIDELKALKPELMVVVAFRILPSEVYTIPSRGAFNLHASLLPKYRGAAPINWAIIRGERETGVTTFFLQQKVDTGGVILQARVPIGENETAGELHDKLAEIGAEIVLHTVRLIEHGKVTPHPQVDTLATGAPKIEKEACRIDWSKPADEIHNFVRGLSPRPCAYTFHHDTLLKIFRTRRVDGLQAGSTPGGIVESGDRLLVATGTEPIEILELQQEGKRKLYAPEFLRGYAMNVGDHLA
jgi:methionyl-tRNA formyltransferase